MTGKLKLGERDWLWPLRHHQWKSKKRDWLDLEKMIVREITRHGEADFHARNHPQSFRKLRRRARFEKAEKKLKELWEDRTSVLGHSNTPGDFILGPNKPNITLDEALDMLHVSTELDNDILRLLDKLSGSTGDINALWRVIDRVGVIGRFMGAHPYQNEVSMKRARNQRVRWWHKPAIALQISDDIYQEFKDKSGGPPSSEAVRAVLKRNKKRKSKLDH